MKKEEFQPIFNRLELAFGIQKDDKRDFFFQEYEKVPTWAFKKAIRKIVDEYPGPSFPHPAQINSALEEVYREQPQAMPRDLDRTYCQRCNNIGLYLEPGGDVGKICVCRAGLLKKARLKVGVSAKIADVEKFAEKLRRPELPIKGLKEWNSCGFWEDTKEEHEKWMAAKKKEIEEIDKRRALNPEKERISEDLRKKLIKETISEIKAKKQTIKEEDIRPF